MLSAARPILEHLDELEEAWRRGALSEHDGKGGTRSNRNAELARTLRDALAGLEVEYESEAETEKGEEAQSQCDDRQSP